MIKSIGGTIANIYTGVLTKQMVLDAQEGKAEDAISADEYRRLCGGKMAQMGASSVRDMFKHHRRFRGEGSSGGGVSGGGPSGGAREAVRHRLAKHYA